MKIDEMFSSIQGESTRQGLPTFFIRTAGCNLRCRYCDTPHAQTGGEDIAPEDIVKAAAASRLLHVCITGGEPLLQNETVELAALLIDNGRTVSIETNGTVDASILPESCRRVIDIKCPGSGENGRTHPENLNTVRPTDEFKFVIGDRRDFDYAQAFTDDHVLLSRSTVLLSPVSGMLEPAELAAWMLDGFRGARLNLQLHRIIWPGETRGR